MISAVSAAGKIVDVAEKGSGVLGRIADYWGLGRALDRRSRAKDVDAAVKLYESLYGTDAPDKLKDLLYTKYITESRKLDNLVEVLSIVSEARRGKNNAGTMPQQDWLDAFEDGASHAYEDEIRTLWARLLDEEITSAGSFSKRTLATLKGMNGMEARKLRILCSWSVEIQDQTGRWIPVPLLQSPLECGAGANFDYEAYGRDIRIEADGHFAPGGYVLNNGGKFIEYYHGIEDIPAEHKVFAFPQLSVREQMAASKEIIDGSSLEGNRKIAKKEHEER